MQSIDIETRWGVPRFEDQYESESYLLMGQQLSDRLYRRTDSLSRQTDKQFYPMTEVVSVGLSERVTARRIITGK